MNCVHQVRTLVAGGIGRITLSRPDAINALTLLMIEQIAMTLDHWHDDPAVSLIVLDGQGDRGFCAGGDIVAFRESALADGASAREFWRQEYRLNARIASFPKPIVVVMDGIVMGGGVGLSGHARHRLATERLIWAMPEVTIGFAPDVGGTHLLARAPGKLGTHVALTAARLAAGDAIAMGFADHFVASERIPALLASLERETATHAIELASRASGPPPEARIVAERAAIDRLYAGDDVEEIVTRLAQHESATARAAARAVASSSPTSVKVTLAALGRAAELPSLRGCLEQEFRTSCSFLNVADFTEGIRAAVVDKDRSPHWRPARLEEVSNDTVEGILAGPRGLEPLWP